MTDPATIAKRMTEAQRRWMTTKVEFVRPQFGVKRIAATFPPYNTYQVLKRLGLMAKSAEITPLGLAVRRILQEQENG